MDARSLAGVAASLGPVFAVAGTAALALYGFIQDQVGETEKLHAALDKVSTDIANASEKWREEATAVRTFEDGVRFADKAKQELERMAVDMAAFRAQQLPLWQRFWDSITTPQDFGDDNDYEFTRDIGAKKPGEFEQKRRKEAAEQEASAVHELLGDMREINAQQAIFGEALKSPVQSIKEYNAQLASAKEATALAFKRADAEPTLANFDAYNRRLHEEKSLTTDIKRLQDEIDRSKVKTVGTQKEITTTLRDQANLLADIRGKQQSVRQNPFMSADQKQAALVPLITQEIAAMNAQLQQDVELQKRTTDPTQWTRLQGSIQQADRQVKSLGQSLKTLSFSGTIRAEMTAWVNQFGTTAKQAAGIITSALNTAIASTSQALTNLIFKTGSWKQAFADAAKSIVQNIIQIALQWVVSHTLMKVLSKVFATEQATTSSTAAGETAAAWAPAATAASIATEGEADIVGTAALAAAMAAGKGIVTGIGAFRSGGYTGFGLDTGIAGIVHANEYVFSAPAVRSLGVGYLDSLHSSVSRPGYASGGYAGARVSAAGVATSANAAPRIICVNDWKAAAHAAMQSHEGQTIIVDTISGRRVDLGIDR